MESRISIELRERRGADRVQLRWSESQPAQVSVLIGGVARLDWSGPVPPDAAKQVRAAFQRASPPAAPAAANDTELRWAIDASGSQTWKWDLAGESEPLQRLRLALEAVGHTAYVGAMACRKHGQSQVSAGELDAAVTWLRRGLDLLGDHYADASVLDDTGMKLIVADTHRSQGKKDLEAVVLDRVLESRLGIYRRKFRLDE